MELDPDIEPSGSRGIGSYPMTALPAIPSAGGKFGPRQLGTERRKDRGRAERVAAQLVTPKQPASGDSRSGLTRKKALCPPDRSGRRGRMRRPSVSVQKLSNKAPCVFRDDERVRVCCLSCCIAFHRLRAKGSAFHRPLGHLQSSREGEKIARRRADQAGGPALRLQHPRGTPAAPIGGPPWPTPCDRATPPSGSVTV